MMFTKASFVEPVMTAKAIGRTEHTRESDYRFSYLNTTVWKFEAQLAAYHLAHDTTTKQGQLSGGKAEIQGTPMIKPKEASTTSQKVDIHLLDAFLDTYFVDRRLFPHNKTVSMRRSKS
jgi:hypothetical protein